jgi:hypothetical protein
MLKWQSAVGRPFTVLSHVNVEYSVPLRYTLSCQDQHGVSSSSLGQFCAAVSMFLLALSPPVWFFQLSKDWIPFLLELARRVSVAS